MEKRLCFRRARPAGAPVIAATATDAITRTGVGLGRIARMGADRANAARSATTGAGHFFADMIIDNRVSPPGTRRRGHDMVRFALKIARALLLDGEKWYARRSGTDK